MKVQTVDRCDEETLRALLIDAAGELAGAGTGLLEPKLPWDGHPILLVDADRHPVLISFDMHNSPAALLNGLQASDRLAAALPWVNQVYPALEQRQKPPRLIVVAAEPPPGNQAVLRESPALTLYTCRILRANEDTGLLLARAALPNPQADRTAVPDGLASPLTLVEASRPAEAATADLPSLSEQEAAYFQQL